MMTQWYSSTGRKDQQSLTETRTLELVVFLPCSADPAQFEIPKVHHHSSAYVASQPSPRCCTRIRAVQLQDVWILFLFFLRVQLSSQLSVVLDINCTPVASNSDRFAFLGLWSLFESFQRMQQQIPDCVSHFDACRITNANLLLGSRVSCIPSKYIKQNSLWKNLSARPLGQRHRDAEKHSGWFATRVTPTCRRICIKVGPQKAEFLRALESRAPEISRWCMQPKTSKTIHILAW